MAKKYNSSKIDGKELAERFIEIIKPKCPYCDADISYAYYGYNGSRYCPNCMKELKNND